MRAVGNFAPWFTDPRLTQLPQAIAAAEQYADREISFHTCLAGGDLVADVSGVLRTVERTSGELRWRLAKQCWPCWHQIGRKGTRNSRGPQPRGSLRASVHCRGAVVPPALMRDIFGNPFRPVAFSPAWRTDSLSPSLARCTSAAISPPCRSSPMLRFKMPGATATTSSPTSRGRGRTSAAVGS